MTIREAFDNLVAKNGKITRNELTRLVTKAGQKIVVERDNKQKSRWTISRSWIDRALRNEMSPTPDPVAKAALLNVLCVKEEDIIRA